MYTKYSKDFSIKGLPSVHAIFRHTVFDDLPKIPKDGRIAVYIGAHANFTTKQAEAIDRFCATHDAAVFCDHTSGYRGRYEVHYQLSACQRNYTSDLNDINLCIHIGEVTGDQFRPNFKHVWRVSQDGQLRDTWGKLRRVFMMPEEEFFNRYSENGANHSDYVDELNKEIDELERQIPELPFSNIWMAQHLYKKLPEGSELYLGILHSLRSYNFFKLPAGIQAKCNVGGFGIDGGVSTMMGASFAHPEKIFIGIFGDLAFFYDMNVVGNRHVGNNVRILLINNGKGNEFRNYMHPCYFLGEEAEDYVAAARHYGNKSEVLVKHYAEDLGYEYLTANSKETFITVVERFLTPEITERPMLLEVFTETQDESNALERICNYMDDGKKTSLTSTAKTMVKSAVREVLGDNRIKAVKDFIKGYQ